MACTFREGTFASVFGVLHGALAQDTTTTPALNFTPEELDAWFDHTLTGGAPARACLKGESATAESQEGGVAPEAKSGYTGGTMLNPEAAFSAALTNTDPKPSSTGQAIVSSSSLTVTPSTTVAAVAAAAPAKPFAALAQNRKRETSAEVLRASFMPNAAARSSVFLRSYYGFTGPALYVENSHFREIVEFCGRNDPHFAYGVQQLALQFHDGLLNPATIPHSHTARNAVFAVGGLPAAQQLRSAFEAYCHGGGLTPQTVSAAAPHISISQPHFVFRVSSGDGTTSSGSDRATDVNTTSIGGSSTATPTTGASLLAGEEQYFSAQVRLANLGRAPVSVRILQQARGEDGALVFPDAGSSSSNTSRPSPNVDYHISLDRDSAKKGESVTAVVSLIVKPTAEFGIAEFGCCLAVGPPEATLKVFVTATLVNPHGAVFGVEPPLSCTTIVHSPLGTYRVPVVLATLIATYDARNGLASTTKGPALAEAPAEVEEVLRARDDLDEMGHAPFLITIKTNRLPPQLAHLGPSRLLSLVLLWLCEQPLPIIPADIGTSAGGGRDAAFRFLADAVPPEMHGVVLAIIDLCTRASLTDGAPAATLLTVFGEALATRATGLLIGQRGSAEQMEAAMAVVRATVDRLGQWVRAAQPLYVNPNTKGAR